MCRQFDSSQHHNKTPQEQSRGVFRWRHARPDRASLLLEAVPFPILRNHILGVGADLAAEAIDVGVHDADRGDGVRGPAAGVEFFGREGGTHVLQEELQEVVLVNGQVRQLTIDSDFLGVRVDLESPEADAVLDGAQAGLHDVDDVVAGLLAFADEVGEHGSDVIAIHVGIQVVDILLLHQGLLERPCQCPVYE